MDFVAELTGDGLALRIEGQDWNADPCRMRFPEEVWAAYSGKEALMRELAYINSLAVPILLEQRHVRYSTPRPRYYGLYHSLFEEAIPNLVEDIPDDDADEILGKFRSIERAFAKGGGRERPRSAGKKVKNRVVLPFSFGKDSLLTLATLLDLGYEVFPVLIDERVLPRGFAIKQSMAGELCARFGLNLGQVVNEIQLLSDYEVLEKPPTRLYQVQAYFVYVYAMLPFCEFYGAPLIALNNEFANSLDYLHRQGYLCPIKAMQSLKTTRRLDRMVRDFTGGGVSIVNPIGALGNFAIHRLLHGAYPEFGTFRISCHMEVTDYRRWCHDCERCAHAYLFFRALGQDPREAGFEKSMLDEEARRHLRVFSPFHRRDRYRAFTADEEALALTALHERGDDEPLVELFAREIYPGFSARRGRVYTEVFSPRARPRHPVEKQAAKHYSAKLAGLPPL